MEKIITNCDFNYYNNNDNNKKMIRKLFEKILVQLNKLFKKFDKDAVDIWFMNYLEYVASYHLPLSYSVNENLLYLPTFLKSCF